MECTTHKTKSRQMGEPRFDIISTKPNSKKFGQQYFAVTVRLEDTELLAIHHMNTGNTSKL